MNMKVKYIACVLISTCLVVTAQTNNKKQAVLDEVVQQIVLLSQFITSMQVDQAESIADNTALVNSDAYNAQTNRIDELMNVRDVTRQLMNRIIATDASELAAIADAEMRVDTAYSIGEKIYYGGSLAEVLSGVDTIDELPDLLNVPSTEMVAVAESMDVEVSDQVDLQLTDGKGVGKGLAEIPNIYEEIGRPIIYQQVMDKLHNDFRESTTTPDGGGFNEMNNDATPI
jgi:hypothetical protein